MTKITAEHLARDAFVYVRQSTSDQVLNNHERRRRQYGLVDRARALGWANVDVIDDDLGRSGSGIARPGFEKLLTAICEGRVGAVVSIEASRLARNGRDWHTHDESGERRCVGHLDDTVRPLLTEPWILDVDTTVKPLYGHQEGAVVGYNALKPGRPSHAYRSFMVSGVRLILDVAVEAGKRHSSKHSEPHLWDHLGRQPRACWPVGGEKDWGNQRNMRRCEQEGVHYDAPAIATCQI
jgi:hypothetical protein